MAIRLGNTCANCDNLMKQNLCAVHKVMVSKIYTCDRFVMKASLKDDRNCVTCARYNENDCANPEKASPGMLCAHWAPQHATA